MNNEVLIMEDEICKKIAEIKSIAYLQLASEYSSKGVNEPNYEMTAEQIREYLTDKLLLAAHDLLEYWDKIFVPALRKEEVK